MHLFASLLFALVLMLKRSLLAENGCFFCWKPMPARQESKLSDSLLETDACTAGEQRKLFFVEEQTKLFSVDAFLLGRVNEQANLFGFGMKEKA